MKTLTERLRELETFHGNWMVREQWAIGNQYPQLAATASVAIDIAQEMHALLVECGEALALVAPVVEHYVKQNGLHKNTNYWLNARRVLTKLQDEGVV